MSQEFQADRYWPEDEPPGFFEGFTLQQILEYTRPPTAEAQQAFSSAVEALPFRDNRGRSAYLNYAHGPYSVGLQVNEHYRNGPERPDDSLILLNIEDAQGGKLMMNQNTARLLTDDARASIRNMLDGAAHELTEREANWLHTAWDFMQLRDKTLLSDAVTGLFRTAPREIYEHNHANVKVGRRSQTGKDYLFGTRITGNQAYMQGLPPGRDVVGLVLHHQRRRYEYIRYAGGWESLLIVALPPPAVQRPAAEPARRRATAVSAIEAMRAIRIADAERKHARAHGRDTINDGKLRELTVAIQAMTDAAA